VSEEALCLVQLQPEGSVSSYYPMQGAMTVFGFGRRDTEAPQAFLTETPRSFLVLLTAASSDRFPQVVQAATTDLRVVVGAPKVRP
jgi:hypothetical protein